MSDQNDPNQKTDPNEVSPGKGYKWLIVVFLVVLGVVAIISAGDNGNDTELPATDDAVEDAVTGEDGDGATTD